MRFAVVVERMNEEERHFVDKVLEQVKYKKIHTYISDEIHDHIECLRQDYEDVGIPHKEAYHKAIEQMGDAVEVGKQLHKQHKPEIEWSILGLVTSLVILGLVILSSMAKAYLGLDDHYEVYVINKQVMASACGKQILFIVIGILLFCLLYRLDYTKLKKHSHLIYFFGILVLLLTGKFGTSINGCTKYLSVAGQLIDMTAFIFLPLIIGSVGMIMESLEKSNLTKIISVIVFALTFFIIINLGLSNGLQLLILWSSIMTLIILSKWYTKNKKKALALLFGAYGVVIVCGILCFIFFGKEYQKDRLMDLVEQVVNLQPISYQDDRKFDILSQSKLIGDSNMDIVGRLSDDIYRDYIFIYVIGKWGYLAGIGIMGIILSLIIRIWKAGIRLKDHYGRILYFTIASLFTIRIIMNIIECFGLMTIISTYLPFVSYDYSYIMMDIAMIGLLLGIYRRKNLIIVSTSKEVIPCELVKSY